MDEDREASKTPTADAAEAYLKNLKEEPQRSNNMPERPETNPNFISTDDELHQFLLGGSFNAQRLTGHQLAHEVEIVATGSNHFEDQKREEAGMLRDTARKKAEEDAEKYHLVDEDKVALELLYLGFTQADLLEHNEPYRVKITSGQSTQFKTKGLTVEKGNFDPKHLRADLEAIPRERRGEKPLEKDRLVASPQLWGAILSEFGQMRLLDKGTQIRRSQDPLFRRTAMQGLAIISILEPDPTKYKPQVLEAVPVHEVKRVVIDFQSFKDNLQP